MFGSKILVTSAALAGSYLWLFDQGWTSGAFQAMLRGLSR